MNRLAKVLVVGVIAVGVVAAAASPALAGGRVSVFLNFGAPVPQERIEQVWVPGHFVQQVDQVLVARGHQERRWVPPTVLRTSMGVQAIAPGYFQVVWIPDQYQQRVTQVWVPGHYIAVAAAPHFGPPAYRGGFGLSYRESFAPTRRESSGPTRRESSGPTHRESPGSRRR